MEKLTTMLAMILMVTLMRGQPIASFILDTNSLCEGQWPSPSGGTFTPTNTSDTSSAVGPITYYWQMPNGTPSSSFSMNPGPISFSGVGKHAIKLTVNSSNGVSIYTDSVEVKEIPLASVGLDLNSSNLFCDGDSAILTTSYHNTSSLGNYTFLWSTGDTTSYLDGNGFAYSTTVCYTSGTYSCTITNASGCSSMDSISITVNPLPSPIISPYLTSYLVSSISSGNQWYLDSVLMVGQNGQQLFVPVVNGTYNVEVTDANGCVGWSSDYVVTSVGVGEHLLQSDVYSYTNGHLTILKGSWGLYDFSGRLVMNGAVGTYSVPEGAYILHTEIGVQRIAHIK